MIDFVNHESNVLVATTIIESGIDIPNVNTIIILDADRFGLSSFISCGEEWAVPQGCPMRI